MSRKFYVWFCYVFDFIAAVLAAVVCGLIFGTIELLACAWQFASEWPGFYLKPMIEAANDLRQKRAAGER